jgi:PAS domain S-box-containing protein
MTAAPLAGRVADAAMPSWHPAARAAPWVDGALNRRFPNTVSGGPILASGPAHDVTVIVLLILIIMAAAAVAGLGAMRLRSHKTQADPDDYWRLLLDALPEAVIVADAQRRITHINLAWSSITGYTAQETLGLHAPYPWLPGADADTEAKRPAGGAFPTECQFTLNRADGQAVSLHANTSRIHDSDGSMRAFVTSVRDVTPRVDAERALAQRAVELEFANEQLEALNKELNSANELRADLMGMLSHEINQPITVVHGMASLLAESWDELPDVKRAEHVGTIRKASSQLMGLLADMLTLLRIEAVETRPVPVPLHQAITLALSAVAGGHDIDVQLDEQMCALVDPSHLRQIVVNLVTNASKYGQPPIEVRASHVGSRCVITVSDHGLGVPPEFVPHMFDRFTRAKETAAKPGTGLGLFIVRRLTEANHGTISYQAGQLTCSQFTIELAEAPFPVAAPPALVP